MFEVKRPLAAFMLRPVSLLLAVIVAGCAGASVAPHGVGPVHQCDINFFTLNMIYRFGVE